jgi:hypothetical protein
VSKKGDNLKDNSWNTQSVERCLTRKNVQKSFSWYEICDQIWKPEIIKCIEQGDENFHLSCDILEKTSLFHRKPVKCTIR